MNWIYLRHRELLSIINIAGISYLVVVWQREFSCGKFYDCRPVKWIYLRHRELLIINISGISYLIVVWQREFSCGKLLVLTSSGLFGNRKTACLGPGGG